MSTDRSGSLGDDPYVSRRATTEDYWSTPVNLGPIVNANGFGAWPNTSADGSALYFSSARSGGSGAPALWGVDILPVVDLNADGIVDSVDMCVMVDFWGTDEPSCDIVPMPWGDGIVDIEDLKVLAEHLFEEVPLIQ